MHVLSTIRVGTCVVVLLVRQYVYRVFMDAQEIQT